MSSVENYDGLCGIIPEFADSSNQIRCNYELGHHGPCSFKKFRNHRRGGAGCFNTPDPERGFIESVIYHNDKDDE